MKRRLKRKTFMLLFAFGAGAAFSYLFDPENGRLRRERLSQRITDATADVVSARRQLSDTVDEVAAAAAGEDGQGELDSSVTDALAGDEPLPDIGGVTTPAPEASGPGSGEPGSPGSAG